MTHVTTIPSLATLAMAGIADELARLQQLADDARLPALRESVAQLQLLFDTVRDTLTAGSGELAGIDDGLQGLLALLQLAAVPSFPVPRLLGLLLPLQQQLQRVNLDINQLL